MTTHSPKLRPLKLGGESWNTIEDRRPHLVLYTLFSKVLEPPKWENPEEWIKLYHQTAGHLCNNVCMFAKFLKPRKAIIPLMELLSKEYDQCEIWPPATLKTANTYEGLIQSFRLTADRDHHLLQEAFYPIDLECLSQVTSEKFPKDLRILAKPETGFRVLGPRFHLAILTENCD